MGELLQQALSSGFQVFLHQRSVLFFTGIFSILPFGLLAMLFLYRLEITQDAASLLSGGLCGGILLDALSSFLIFLVSPPGWARGLLIFLVSSVWILDIVLWIRWRFHPRRNAFFYGFLIGAPLLLILKLAFIHGIELPFYTDSVEHFTIIQDLALRISSPHSYYNLNDLSAVYYHFGYHSLIAKQYLLTGTAINQLMLVIGQLFLAIATAGLYFPVYLAADSKLAGLIAVCAAAFVCIMPSYGVNWGKYPTLTAFAAVPFVLGLLITVFKRRVYFARTGFILLLLISIGSTILIHSRFLVLVMIVGAIAVLTVTIKWNRKTLWCVNLALLVTLAVGIFLKVGVISALFEMYWRYGTAPLVVALIASLMCAIQYPRLAWISLWSIWGTILAASIPLQGNLASYTALIDRPYFQIGFYIPMAILTGAGLASLIQAPFIDSRKVLRYTLGLFIGVLLLLSAPLNSVLFPSQCCKLAGEDDLSAYQWLKGRAAGSNQILISGYPTDFTLLGVDGGIWVEPLTGIPTEMVPYSFDFSSVPEKRDLCNQQITYIYAGSFFHSFHRSQLESNPQWYAPEVTFPGVEIFKLKCEPAR